MPKAKRISEKEERRLMRLARLDRYAKGKLSAPMILSAVPKSRDLPKPKVTGLGDRSGFTPKFIPIHERLTKPLGEWQKDTALPERDKGKFYMKDVGSAELPKVLAKITAKIQDEQDYMNSYWGWIGIIQPEYELLEPWAIFDTEAYFRLATERKQSLMFRNGFKVIGTNESYRQYIEKRFSTIAFMMKTSLTNFFRDVLTQLLVVSNCIILKIRDEQSSLGTANPKNKNKKPVAAYVIIPSNTIYPYLDGKGRVEKWRRFFADGRTFEDYPVEDIIHFYWDKKAGHIFGTPRIVPVRDDILAFRRLEENVELLLIHHLFPLFHISVGTEEEPADYHIEGISEVDFVRNEIESMPKEGMFVTDGRVHIEAVGARGTALDYKDIVQHYKQRVFTGLGVSSVDMGEGDTANRGTAEAVSQNLKDSVKADMDWFCGQVQMLMILEFFQEAPFELSVQNAVADVHLEFPEIDVDGMIKTENHGLNLFNSHLITEQEARQRLHKQNMTPEDRKNTHYQLHVLDLALRTAKAKAQFAAEYGLGPAEKKATPQKGKPKVAEQPENQHGRNLDPHKAKSSASFFDPLYDILMAMRSELSDKNSLTLDDWRIQSSKAIYLYFHDLTKEELYTNQERMDEVRDVILSLLGETYDPDLISAILKSVQDDLPEGLIKYDQETDTRPPVEPAQGSTPAGSTEFEQGLGDGSQAAEGTDTGVSTGS